jgi:hypothetical protein
MKIKMHISTVTASLAIATAAIMIASEIGKVPLESLAVHEWGTFTSVAGADGSAIEWNVLGGKDDLPKFVNSRGYRCFKFRLAGNVRMETPVLYFYSKREITANVAVQFPHGVITEWYPKGATDIYESKNLMDRMNSPMGSRIYSDDQVYKTAALMDPPPPGLDPLLVKLSPSINGFDTSLLNLMSTITWNDIKVQPDTTPDLPTEDRPSRYYAARTTDADPVSVGDNHEKFLFYRGVGRMQVPLTARISPDGKIVIAKNGSDSVPMVMLFENQAGRLGYTAGHTVGDSITLDRPSLNGNRTELADQLEKALEAQGLFWKEAHAMVTTWQDSWFEEGARLIYIVPPHVVDSFLPLHVDPLPAQTARVFVGRIELITPEVKRSLQVAISKHDVATATGYGRFLEPILDRILDENPTSTREINQFRGDVLNAMASGTCR